MAQKNEDTLYVRNARPNSLVIRYAGTRQLLGHRGSRTDSWALPREAENDQTIARWLKSGHLEKISKESYMKLSARTIDVLPNEYLEKRLRQRNGLDVKMSPADADTTRTLTQITDGDVHKQVRDTVSPKWAGELMTTEEELESTEFETQQADYPSHHRDSEARRQMGY
jgi:hypothetical protein